VAKDRSIWLEPLFLAGMLSGGFVICLTLWFGIGSDASVYSYCSWVWRHYGQPPYVGCMVGDYPGIFIIHRLALIFGESALGFRIFDVLVQLGCLGMIFWLARRVSGLSLAGFLAGLFYATYYYSLEFMMVGERESFIFFLMLSGVLAGVAFSRRIWVRAVLAGLCCGFVFLVKPTFGLCWPVFGAWFLVEGLRSSRKKLRAELLVFGASCLLPAMLVIIYYWSMGHLRELYEVCIQFVLLTYTRFPLRVGTPDHIFKVNAVSIIPYLFKQILRDYLLALAGAAMLFLRPSFYRGLRERRLLWVIASLALVSLVSAYLQRGVWPYHRAPFWGFMLIFAGWGWAEVLGRVKGPRPVLGRRMVVWGVGLVLVLLMVLRVPGYLRWFAVHNSFRDLKSAYLQQYPVVVEAAEYLKQALRPEDEVYYLGNITMLPFLMQHKLSAPFPFTVYLYQRLDDGSFSPLQERWKRDYVEGFFRLKPRVFILDKTCWYCPGQSLLPVLASEFPELKNALERDYHLARSFEGIEIFERN